MKVNYDDKLLEIKKMICNWSKRNLSTLGRITVVKTLLIPKLTHLFMALPNPDNDYFQKINRMLFNYIWNSKIDRIARKYIIRDYDEGGLKMINIEVFIKSLKITWLRRFYQSDSSWATLLKSSLPSTFSAYPIFGSLFLKSLNLHLNPFWKNVFEAVEELRALVPEHVLTNPLWYNKKNKTR